MVAARVLRPLIPLRASLRLDSGPLATSLPPPSPRLVAPAPPLHSVRLVASERVPGQSQPRAADDSGTQCRLRLALELTTSTRTLTGTNSRTSLALALWVPGPAAAEQAGANRHTSVRAGEGRRARVKRRRRTRRSKLRSAVFACRLLFFFALEQVLPLATILHRVDVTSLAALTVMPFLAKKTST